MSKLGKRLIEAAREGRAIVRGEADPTTTYRVYVPAETDATQDHQDDAGRRPRQDLPTARLEPAPPRAHPAVTPASAGAREESP